MRLTSHKLRNFCSESKRTEALPELIGKQVSHIRLPLANMDSLDLDLLALPIPPLNPKESSFQTQNSPVPPRVPPYGYIRQSPD